MAASGGKSPAIELEVGDRTVRISNPDRVYFPARGETKLDLAQLLPERRRRDRPGAAGTAVHAAPLPRRRRAARRCTRSGCRTGRRPGSRRCGCTSRATTAHADELCVTELAQRDLGGADVHGGVPPVELAPGRHREARRVAHRPGSDAATCDFDRVRRVAHVAHEVLDELGAVGWPKTSGGTGLHIYVRIAPRLGVRRRAPGRPGVRPRGRAAGARRRDHRVVAQGPGPGPAVRGLQPERPRPHDRQRLLGARRTRTATVSDPDPVGRDRRRRCPHDFTIATVPARFAALGDLHAGIDDAVFSLETLLEWAERDEREGAADPGGPADDSSATG